MSNKDRYLYIERRIFRAEKKIEDAKETIKEQEKALDLLRVWKEELRNQIRTRRTTHD